MILICNVCGTSFDTEDDSICPNCGSLSTHPQEDE